MCRFCSSARATESGDVEALRQTREAQLFKSREGLWTLAEETGGLFIHNDNFIEDAVKQAIADTEGYYLIGYHPDAKTFDAKTGKLKFHRLEVKLRKSGLHVRSRGGFFGESDAEARNVPRNGHEELIHAVTSPFASGDVHLRLTALFQQSSDGRPFIDTMLHIDAADLKFTPQPDGGQKAALEVEGMTFGESGTPVDQSDRFFDIALNAAQYAGVQKYGLVYRVNQPLQHAGMYQVRVGLRDRDSGRLGSASQFMETPDISQGRLVLSSLVLAEDPSRPNDSGAPHPEGRMADTDLTSSAADRVFKPGTALSYR